MIITVVPASDAEADVWRTTLEVARLFGSWPWVLIGAQAISLLALERGESRGRATRDIDVVIDVRVVADGAHAAAARLVQAGFDLSAEHPYRFTRDADRVDLLAPDNLGPRADLTTIPPATTIEIPGATRAIATRHVVSVEVVGVGSGSLSIPSLGGALVLKSAAWTSRRAERDLEDLVRLLDMVDDPAAVHAELKPAERRRLAAIAELADARHPAWRVARDPNDARAALARLTT
ncbi:MAG: hypothetical protein ACLQBX_05155 [Candidatus Limnocylindrales bacterium]